MATKVVMEALSPTMEEGRLVKWKKNEGDAVAVGDVLAEVETDKAMMELVARGDGVLLKQVIPDGTTAPVASVVAWIGAAGEDDSRRARAPTAAAAAPATRARGARPGGRDSPGAARCARTSRRPRPQAAPATRPGAGARVKASPLGQRVAAERGLDLGAIAGSGPEGRIVVRDLEGAVLAPAATATGFAASVYTDVPLTQIRKTIAQRLVQSIGPIPTFYLTAEVDMERAPRCARRCWPPTRRTASSRSTTSSSRPSPRRSRSIPGCNAWWSDDHIRYCHDVHIGMAVAIDDGLIMPIIRDADQQDAARDRRRGPRIAGRAREKRLKPEEYTGATFSISNLGMFGIDQFTAIINPPEAAILAVGRLEQKPVVVDGELVVRRRMRITLCCDHRVIDGAIGATFLKTLVGMLENPLAMVW